MRRVVPITEQFQHFLKDLQQSFWGDLYGMTRMVWKRALEEESARLREVYWGCDPYERVEGRRGHHNGFYLRDFVTRLGTLRLKIARSRGDAELAFRVFRAHWQGVYTGMVKRLERDLPELLSFFEFPPHLWRKLRTTNIIERCFVEVRRRTRPMVCFVNVASVDRIIYSIFNRFNDQWRNRTLRLFTQAA